MWGSSQQVAYSAHSAHSMNSYKYTLFSTLLSSIDFSNIPNGENSLEFLR